MRLQERVITVTGAASGIGRAIAVQAAKEGAKVVVSDVNEAGGAETVDLIEADGGTAAFLRTDISREGDAQALVDFAVETYGRLDGCANNAGIALASHPLHETPTDLWLKTQAVNATGTFFQLRAQLAYLAEHGGGAIVNTASLAGITPAAGVTSYAASKFAVIGLTKQAALEYVGNGVRVNAIAPGVIRTPIFDNSSPEEMAAFEALQPGGRLGEPEEMATVVCFLLSDEASYVNGAILNADMGATAF
ncbi:SDR family oxidoreductase [Georgenia yuyongxinii]|uniref:SDR family oxidoreductase n=1 Tax=Georgenia yuyongxinii TaxID=2589797 RepID=A0A5B8C4T1_9MICO|nr:SDR family NAD(P)-dependent oxidoreductase [Georgenia yuyongxinii]QDC25328.1 SDR family oxidoreductase [Georgenia yuyongxinii]